MSDPPTCSGDALTQRLCRTATRVAIMSNTTTARFVPIVLMVAAKAFGGQAAAGQATLRLLEPVAIVIEHPSNKGSARLMIQNTSTMDVPLELSDGDFVSSANSSAVSLGTKTTIAWTTATGQALAAPPAD